MKYMICFSIEKKIGYFFCPFDFLLFFQENFNFYLYLPQQYQIQNQETRESENQKYVLYFVKVDLKKNNGSKSYRFLKDIFPLYFPEHSNKTWSRQLYVPILFYHYEKLEKFGNPYSNPHWGKTFQLFVLHLCCQSQEQLGQAYQKCA